MITMIHYVIVFVPVSALSLYGFDVWWIQSLRQKISCIIDFYRDTQHHTNKQPGATMYITYVIFLTVIAQLSSYVSLL